MMVEEILLQESRPRKQPVRIRTGEGIQEDHLKTLRSAWCVRPCWKESLNVSGRVWSWVNDEHVEGAISEQSLP